MSPLVLAIFTCFCIGLSTQLKYTPQQKEILETNRKLCVDKYKPDKELLARTYKGEVINDDAVQSYVICLSVELKVMNEAGDVFEDAYYRLYPEIKGNDKVDAGLAKCKSLSKDTSKETNYVRAFCIFGLTYTFYAEY